MREGSRPTTSSANRRTTAAAMNGSVVVLSPTPWTPSSVSIRMNNQTRPSPASKRVGCKRVIFIGLAPSCGHVDDHVLAVDRDRVGLGDVGALDPPGDRRAGLDAHLVGAHALPLW